MRNLIKSDLRRILKKKGFWIGLVLSYAYMIGIALYQMSEKWNGFSFMSAESALLPALTSLVMGLVLFMSVYADEFSAMAMTTVIGRGLSRTKIVLAKLLDELLISLILFAFLTAGVFLLGLVTRAHMSAVQSQALFVSMMTGVYLTVGYLAASGAFLFITSNVPLSVLIYLILTMVIPLAMTFLQQTAFGMKYHPQRFYFEGISFRIFASVMLHDPADALLWCIAGLLVYAGLPTLIGILIFRKRELDF